MTIEQSTKSNFAVVFRHKACYRLHNKMLNQSNGSIKNGHHGKRYVIMYDASYQGNDSKLSIPDIYI
jgi:hypothetical protein